MICDTKKKTRTFPVFDDLSEVAPLAIVHNNTQRTGLVVDIPLFVPDNGRVTQAFHEFRFLEESRLLLLRDIIDEQLFHHHDRRVGAAADEENASIAALPDLAADFETLHRRPQVRGRDERHRGQSATPVSGSQKEGRGHRQV